MPAKNIIKGKTVVSMWRTKREQCR